jgi:glycosyltransferase involved in cell wall biosynthesis
VTRLRLLALSFFPAFDPPRSGGEERLLGFYRALSAHHDVQLLTWTHPGVKAETVRHGPNFVEHRLPKHEAFIDWHGRLDEEARLGADVSGLVCSLVGDTDRLLAAEIETRKPGVDAILHDFPYTVASDDDIGFDGIPRFYLSHNLEWRMVDGYYGGPWKAHYVSHIREREAMLARHACAVSFTGEPDREGFQRDFDLPPDKLFMLPNGISVPGTISRAPTPRQAVFIGSIHEPNRVAARWIVDVLAPACPDWRFTLLGSVCKAFSDEEVPPNVRLAGVVEDHLKTELFASASLALNPMTLGSGTNLKMLDFMAHGLPVVTTPFGARGLALEDGRTALVTELEGFVDVLGRLASEAEAEGMPSAQAEAIGQAARQHVLARFTWEAIASAAAREIAVRAQAARGQTSRKSLVLLNDYPVAGLRAGGAARISQLFSRFVADYRIHLLSLTRGESPSRARIAGGFTEESFPWPVAMREGAARAVGRHWLSIDDILAGRHATEQAQLCARLDELMQQASVLILQQCYLAPVVEQWRARAPDSPVRICYDSQNFEVDLKATLFADHPDRDALIATTRELERLAVSLSSQVVCVSESDAGKYRRAFAQARIDVVENGVELRPQPAPRDPDRLTAVFIGSPHGPNIEAARFIVERLAPACPEIAFVIVGGCCTALRDLPAPMNLRLAGELDDIEKRRFFESAHVGLNPVFSGGGSSLKMGDYMASGLVVVSSAFGARGYELVPDCHFLVAGDDSPQSFRLELYLLLRNPALREEISAKARDWVARRIDWNVLARRYRQTLEARRLLAVTYRFTDPPRGGAETYLYELLERLEARHGWLVDVASTDASDVENRHHFGASWSRGLDDLGAPAFVRKLHRAPVTSMSDAASLSAARELMALWNRELPAIVDGLRPLWAADSPWLLDGWYWPESLSGQLVRWSAPRARIWVPAGVRALRLKLAAGAPKLGWQGLEAGSATTLSSGASIDVPEAGGVLVLEAAERLAEGDPRLLGVYLTGIELLDRDGSWQALTLDASIEVCDWLAHAHPQAWVAALMKVAAERDPDCDERFLALRGPVSPGLSQWLEAHARDYDAVIAQGVPFAVPTMVLQALAACEPARRPPVVVLPHFHVEDRYYHWQAFYRAMREADLTVLAPRELGALLAEPQEIRCALLPGGGIDLADYQELEACREAFRSRFDMRRPFFLVLGRKTGSKGYQRAIDALGVLNARGQRAELLIVGPDGDGRPVERADVRYPGPLPRREVIGALADCVAVVSMSHSESFGIVLVEAWACGRPVVALSHNLAFRELVEHGVNGLLVDDDKSLAAAMAQLLDSPLHADQMGAAGRVKARSAYTWDSLAQAWGTTLEQLETVKGSAGQ